MFIYNPQDKIIAEFITITVLHSKMCIWFIHNTVIFGQLFMSLLFFLRRNPSGPAHSLVFPASYSAPIFNNDYELRSLFFTLMIIEGFIHNYYKSYKHSLIMHEVNSVH